jgi:hypothetical protein
MSVEQILSVVVGLASLTVAWYFVWTGRSAQRKSQRLAAQYRLYERRDVVIRLAATGEIDPNSDMFTGLVDLINVVIGLDRDADYQFFAWLKQAAASSEARSAADEMLQEACPGLTREDVDKLLVSVGQAIEAAICANSRMMRLELISAKPVQPRQTPKNVGSIG